MMPLHDNISQAETQVFVWDRPHPAETVDRVLEHKKLLGLTRLADITRLDRIGIPVVLSVRPGASYLSVDTGKGITLDHSRASAAMECVERFCGENAKFETWWSDYETCAISHNPLPKNLLPLSKNSLFNARLPFEWTEVADYVSGELIAIPAEILALDRPKRTLSETLPFQSSSNGLSAGNTMDEALFGGLCELIERDALALMWGVWNQGIATPPRIDLEAITSTLSPVTQSLLKLSDQAGVETIVFDCTQDIDVPVFMAYMIDHHTPEFGLFRGYGCHLDPEMAVQRAITEAAQGRLVHIAGSRDDMFGHKRTNGRSLFIAGANAITDVKPTCALRARDIKAPANPKQGVNYLINKIKATGLRHILVQDLTWPSIGIPAVRVLIPGLEGYMFETYAPGKRALNAIELAKDQKVYH